MKATGIVRRIDDLGRVVIPKEIRRTMRIREGTPLEIFTDANDQIILKKYSPVLELQSVADEYAQALSEILNCTVIIADRDAVVAAYGPLKKDYKEKTLNEELVKAMDGRKNFIANKSAVTKLIKVLDDESDSDEYFSQCAVPIMPNGDVIGCVVAFTKSKGKEFGETVLSAVRLTSSIISMQML